MRKQLLLALSFCLLGSFIHASAEGEIITLDLSKPTTPAVIEFTEDGYWVETYNDEIPELVFSPFRISHLKTGDSWGGSSWDSFTISKNGSAEKPSGFDAWGCMTGGGIKTTEDGYILLGSANKIVVDSEIPYVLAYWPAFMEYPGSPHYNTISFDDDYLYEPVGFYVANNPQSYYYNIDGGIAKDGDFFKLIIGGTDAEGNDIDTTVEYYLAWMENGKLYQPEGWEWVDLSSLGAVAELYFTMESTDNGDWGINTPTYFCLDKLQVIKTNQKGTAIQPVAPVASAKVFPTAFSDRITVESEKAINKIQIFDTTGKLIYTANPGNKQYTILTESLTKGGYILKLTDGESFSVHKIIKK